MEIDQSKLNRQNLFIDKWVANKGIGTLVACTGFGKTYAAMLIMQRMQKRFPNRKFHIVVPKIELKLQWEELLKELKLSNAEVSVINGLVLRKKKIKVDLLILDEIHRYPSDSFYKLFELIEYTFILGLTATIERLDGKHTLVEEKAPVLDTISLMEAKRKGWVSDFREYNLPTPYTEADQKEYAQVNKSFHYYFSFFQHNFNRLLAARQGDKEVLLDTQLLFDIDKDTAYKMSVMAMQFMHKRKSLLQLASGKRRAIIDIIKLNPDKKILIFSESAKFANIVAKDVNSIGEGRICMPFHVDIKAKKRRDAIRLYKSSKSKVRVLSTVKSLDEGFSEEDVEIAIIASGTSNPTQAVQRTGRAVRTHTFEDGSIKKAVVINLYVPDFNTPKGTVKSQDVKWLTKRQVKSFPIWVEDIDEIDFETKFNKDDI